MKKPLIQKKAEVFFKKYDKRNPFDKEIRQLGKFTELSICVPGNVPGSYTRWVKVINQQARTIKLYHDTFDKTGNFVNRGIKIPKPEHHVE
jgi:hypothetical protein